MKYKIRILGILILISTIMVSAENVGLKYSGPIISEAVVNELIILSFTIENNEDIEKELILTREINYAMGESIVTHEGAEIKRSTENDLNEPYLEYHLTLSPKKSKEINIEINYEIIPTKGTLELSPITITDSSGERVIAKTEKRDIEIKCNVDNYCDLKSRENNKNCPQD